MRFAVGLTIKPSARAEFNPHDWQVRLRAINVSPDESFYQQRCRRITADVGLDPWVFGLAGCGLYRL